MRTFLPRVVQVRSVFPNTPLPSAWVRQQNDPSQPFGREVGVKAVQFSTPVQMPRAKGDRGRERGECHILYQEGLGRACGVRRRDGKGKRVLREVGLPPTNPEHTLVLCTPGICFETAPSRAVLHLVTLVLLSLPGLLPFALDTQQRPFLVLP